MSLLYFGGRQRKWAGSLPQVKLVAAEAEFKGEQRASAKIDKTNGGSDILVMVSAASSV